MKITIIHHHLNPGGVTRIIQSQIQSLLKANSDIEIKLLVGNKPENISFPKEVKVKVFDALNYLLVNDINKTELETGINTIYNYLLSEISKDEIIHFHNLNLGKNPLVTIAINKMLKQGYKVLNHEHDFAEDRPVNWEFLTEIIVKAFNLDLNDCLYPKHENYKIAVLNSFDFNRLQDYNFPVERTYLLPNPVTFKIKIDFSKKETYRKNIVKTLNLDSAKKIFTYPVRVIKRKNIGEYILLAALFSDKANWLVTQPPKNPKEITEYEIWKQFCTDNNINVHFEAGQKVNFEELLYISDACLTTSIQEGFGMVYMEPWLLHTPVLGRNIEYITVDLKNKGVQFPVLYNKLHINNIDFKDYPANQQRELIINILNNSVFKSQFLNDNKILIDIFERVDNSVIQHNIDIINEGFSLQKYAEELYDIYEGFA